VYVVTGMITFTDENDAAKTFLNLLDSISGDTSIIEYSKILILQNTHHYKNPLPDVILDERITGKLKDYATTDSKR